MCDIFERVYISGRKTKKGEHTSAKQVRRQGHSIKTPNPQSRLLEEDTTLCQRSLRASVNGANRRGLRAIFETLWFSWGDKKKTYSQLQTAK